jgi:hypothetical protein
VVGTDYGLYSTIDRGATWHKQSEIPNVSVNTVQIRKSDRKVFIYTHGRGMFTANLKNINNASVKALNQPKFTVYPNPGKDYLKIDGDYSAAAIYTILDATGKRLKAAFLTREPIDVSALPKGVYYIIIKQNGTSQTQKWVKE